MLVCRNTAFSRLFSMLSRKNLTIGHLFFISIIILFSIPFRILVLFYKLIIKNKNSIYDGLLYLYEQEYVRLAQLKIELYDHRICYPENSKHWRSLFTKTNLAEDEYGLITINELQYGVVLNDMPRTFDTHPLSNY